MRSLENDLMMKNNSSALNDLKKISLFKEFEDNEKAVAYLESVRWKDGVVCPKCKSDKTCKHHVHNRTKKWQCWNCEHSFGVTVGTKFHHTHIPLNKWFWLIAMMLNAKKGLSSYQAARELEMRRPTVGLMMHRIRKALATDQMDLLKVHEVIEGFEACLNKLIAQE